MESAPNLTLTFVIGLVLIVLVISVGTYVWITLAHRVYKSTPPSERDQQALDKQRKTHRHYLVIHLSHIRKLMTDDLWKPNFEIMESGLSCVLTDELAQLRGPLHPAISHQTTINGTITLASLTHGEAMGIRRFLLNLNLPEHVFTIGETPEELPHV